MDDFVEPTEEEEWAGRMDAADRAAIAEHDAAVRSESREQRASTPIVEALTSGLVEPDHLFLVAADGGAVRLYLIGADLRPVVLGITDSPRHGRGSLGHGYTTACDPTSEQCNNSQCRAGRNHDRCAPACSGETYWDDLGPWQIAPARREAFLAALGR